MVGWQACRERLFGVFLLFTDLLVKWVHHLYPGLVFEFDLSKTSSEKTRRAIAEDFAWDLSNFIRVEVVNSARYGVVAWI